MKGTKQYEKVHRGMQRYTKVPKGSKRYKKVKIFNFPHKSQNNEMNIFSDTSIYLLALPIINQKLD